MTTAGRRSKAADRRSSGLLRVPFIQRCHLLFDDGVETSAFLVNINVLGAYVAYEPLPVLGKGLTCRFRRPGHETEIKVEGAVAWVNAYQQHPVHSLPPGFGIKFERMTAEEWGCIEQLVQDYLARHPSLKER